MNDPGSRSIFSPCGVGLRALVLLGALGGLGAACRQVEAVDPHGEVRTYLQRRSLEQVFLTQGSPPPAPDAAERAAWEARTRALADERPEELAELEGIIRDPELRLLAMRDSDGDGLHDYRIGPKYGRFQEGDLDLDGDGISNTLDAAPYDPEVGGSDENGDGTPDQQFDDRDADGIPDHVDWSATANHEVAHLQEELFADHDILLVGRSAQFTPTMARSSYDALTRVFNKSLEEGGLPALRVIATDETCLLFPEDDPEAEINAVVIPQTRSLLVYRVGLDYAPIVQLGLQIHELGHVWQFSQDFDTDDLHAENRRVNFESRRFLEMVEPFGWSTEQQPYDPAKDDYLVFTNQDHAFGPEHEYKGRSSEEAQAELSAIAEEVGEGYLEDSRAAGIVGDYSLSNPFEWHADTLLAYVYSSLEARAFETLPDEAEALSAALTDAARKAWPSFRYQNFDREALEAHYTEHFPLADADLDYILEHYLRPLIE